MYVCIYLCHCCAPGGTEVNCELATLFLLLTWLGSCRQVGMHVYTVSFSFPLRDAVCVCVCVVLLFMGVNCSKTVASVGDESNYCMFSSRLLFNVRLLLLFN